VFLIIVFCVYDLQLVNGQVHYSYNGESVLMLNGYASDGHWHHIEVKWMSGELWINLDYGQQEVTSPATNKLQGLYVGKILIGGPDASVGSLNADYGYFEGCIQVSSEHLYIVRFELLTAVMLKVQVFWDVMLCAWANSF